MTKGQLHSVETRTRISVKRIGMKFTEEHSKNISRALTGRPKSPLHKKAISDGIRLAKQAQATTIKDERSWNLSRTGKLLIGTRRDSLVIKVAEENDPQGVFADRMLILSRIEANQLLEGLNQAMKQRATISPFSSF